MEEFLKGLDWFVPLFQCTIKTFVQHINTEPDLSQSCLKLTLKGFFSLCFISPIVFFLAANLKQKQEFHRTACCIFHLLNCIDNLWERKHILILAFTFVDFCGIVTSQLTYLLAFAINLTYFILVEPLNKGFDFTSYLLI